MKLPTGVFFLLLIASTFALAQVVTVPEKKQAEDKSKTERCMDMDYKDAMACLNGVIVDHNRAAMRKAIKQ